MLNTQLVMAFVMVLLFLGIIPSAVSAESEINGTSDTIKCQNCLNARIICNMGSHSSNYCDQEYKKCLGGVIPPDADYQIIKRSDDLRRDHCLKMRIICNTGSYSSDYCDQKYIDCMGKD